MMRFRAALESTQIVLDLEAATLVEAIRKLAETLRADPRVGSWRELVGVWEGKGGEHVIPIRTGVAFIHVRTKAVSDLVMSFARLHTPVRDHDELIHFIVLMAIPLAVDARYARLVGTLMRVLRNERFCEAFYDAKRPEDVLAVLERAEVSLAS
ncbi:MAG: PTS sugar transporter subunit IIA [Verrucomicrobia bacterium]|nr:PTS sugar transporter subunit IIA [Verrucomicrobiota bacterium]